MPHFTAQLTRLECRDLLAHLNEGVDPDVLEKIKLGARATTTTGRETDPPQLRHNPEPPPGDDTPKIDIQIDYQQLEKTVLLRNVLAENGGSDGNTFFSGLDDPRIVYANEQVRQLILSKNPNATPEQIEPYLWHQEDIDRANSQRKQIMDAQEKMKRRQPNLNQFDAANADFALPDVPPGFGIERVAKGNVNSAGDKCIDITPEGVSVFQCGKGHVYYGNNPATKGCSQCELSGGVTTMPQRTDEDEEEDAGYEQF